MIRDKSGFEGTKIEPHLKDDTLIFYTDTESAAAQLQRQQPEFKSHTQNGSPDDRKHVPAIGYFSYIVVFINHFAPHIAEKNASPAALSAGGMIDFCHHSGYTERNMAGPSAEMYGSAFYFPA
tara:strand:- start:10238 stop:10606 length:369 start_codon:yes stop_codon:yes gene_type:complete